MHLNNEEKIRIIANYGMVLHLLLPLLIVDHCFTVRMYELKYRAK